MIDKDRYYLFVRSYVEKSLAAHLEKSWSLFGSDRNAMYNEKSIHLISYHAMIPRGSVICSGLRLFG